MRNLRFRFGIVGAALLFAIATTMPVVLITTDAAAQEITASIHGTVIQPDGQPAAGATATVTDSRDGRRRTATTDSRGVVSFRSISAGGPYTVRISGDGFEDVLITDLYTDVAGTSSFTVTFEAANASIDEVVVTAAQIETITTASGPSSSFSLEQITDMPSTQRQIRDIIRIDPRISVGQTGDGGDQSGAISCLGGSSRTNSFTIDGVRATDAFGLNLSGNLARFTFPIPFDTVQAAAVEFAPVSVEYGQFSGCNVNVVTKSGENDWHGGGFYLFNDDSLTGDKIHNSKFDQGTFERKNYGAEVSGPIIQDKLFFYLSYEKFDTATVNQVGAADDTSFPQNDTVFTTAEVNQIRDILSSSYGRDAGSVVRNLPVTSERIFARIDWNINDDHRLEGTFSSLEETTTIGDDIGTGRGEFTFSDNFHFRGSDSDTFALRLYSDWTDRLSTEIRYSTQEVTDLQNPLGGGEAQDAIPIPRIAIGGSGQFGGEFFGQEFVSGPGTFRSANRLATEKDQLKIKMDYQVGDHLITAGYEYETLDVFNLFIINATGTVFFDSIANLAAGAAYEIRSGVSFTQDPNDAAAIYGRDINSLFVQDQWDINDAMQLVFGVRYDWYESNDLPLENPNYVARYGMSNQVGYDGLDAFQPRIGLNYTLPDKFGDTRMSLGFGVFSGNDPTVWFSNAYQNFGGALGVGSATGFAGPTTCTAADLNVLASGSFQGIPQCVIEAGQQQALNNAGAVNATDPNIKLPTVNRFSFGLEHNTSFESDLMSDWNVKLDIIYADLKDQVDFLDLSLTQTGTAPDGRPTYSQIDPLLLNCNATFNGARQGFSNVTPDCFGGNQDVYFTNKPGDGGHTFTTSIQANKSFDWGDTSQLNLVLGYSYNESEIGNPGTSFTAAENFRAVVADDIVNLPVGPSLRNTPHNFVIASTFSKEIWSGYKSSVTAFFQRRSGSPISTVFNGSPYSGDIGDTGGRARNLLYVPTDASDPLVNFDPGFDTTAFFDWADKNDLKRGAIQKKGSFDQAWSSDLDLRFQQEIPFFGGATGKVYFDIENVLNLIDSQYGRKRYVNTQDIGSAVGVVTAGIDGVTNTYNFTSFTPPVELPDTWDSLYRIQLGIRVDF
ncbi:MAG: TonB-dependent receptor [Gammaproteobacteria bacterium]|nr:TonB-dependent receptor [Gammaproteobacteria bacterium]MDH3414849.1 TonB-dependent receptor [Gammaproteobacteria bacterium]